MLVSAASTKSSDFVQILSKSADKDEKSANMSKIFFRNLYFLVLKHLV